jgi:hypothetical protein
VDEPAQALRHGDARFCGRAPAKPLDVKGTSRISVNARRGMTNCVIETKPGAAALFPQDCVMANSSAFEGASAGRPQHVGGAARRLTFRKSVERHSSRPRWRAQRFCSAIAGATTVIGDCPPERDPDFHVAVVASGMNRCTFSIIRNACSWAAWMSGSSFSWSSMKLSWPPESWNR